MISEQQKYFSGVLRTVGFALLAPASTLVFQWFILKEGAFFEHFFHAVIPFLLGWLVIFYGYIILKERNK